MTDHAAVIRGALKASGKRTGYTLQGVDPLAPSSPFVEYFAEEALAALAALEQELAEAKRERDSWRTLAEGWKLTDDIRDHRV